MARCHGSCYEPQSAQPFSGAMTVIGRYIGLLSAAEVPRRGRVGTSSGQGECTYYERGAQGSINPVKCCAENASRYLAGARAWDAYRGRLAKRKILYAKACNANGPDRRYAAVCPVGVDPRWTFPGRWHRRSCCRPILHVLSVAFRQSTRVRAGHHPQADAGGDGGGAGARSEGWAAEEAGDTGEGGNDEGDLRRSLAQHRGDLQIPRGLARHALSLSQASRPARERICDATGSNR